MSVDPDEYDGPVFGEGPVLVKPIRIVVHGPGDPPEGRQEQFNALQDMDAGMMINVVRARTEDEQTQAAMRLILNVVVDSDGLASTYEPPRTKAGDIDVKHADYDDRLEDEEQWSSLRRLSWLVDDPAQYIKLSALTDLAKYMVEQAGGGRPTGPSRPSSTGPRRSGRGSGAQRS